MIDAEAAEPAEPAADGARFAGNLAAPPPIPAAARQSAMRVMERGALFRYAQAEGGDAEAASLEVEFADYTGARYCVAVNSCGCALFLALRAAGVAAGDPVLVNAFTLAPVAGAIAHAGGVPVLVDITEDLVVDMADLRRKIRSSGARHLMLSHMRGHVGDLEAVAALCAAEGVTLIEDCAHTPGARWNGRLTGRFGAIGCFSAQSYKHLNGGEGGLIVTDDPDLAAQMILMSGSYMLYAQHRARPDEACFERWRMTTPNFSMRMNGLTAAILRPQLAELDARVDRWRAIHDRIAARLARAQAIYVPALASTAHLAPTSIQFLLQGVTADEITQTIDRAKERGVAIKWFGADKPVGFTSRPDHWQFFDGAQTPPAAARILAKLCDIRLPLELSDAECDLIGEIVVAALPPKFGSGM
ncbi:MAG: aminotransferase class I/II-fold pyridoxal phosphate-dependent enzyme [Pseudomonadota bacterium]